MESQLHTIIIEIYFHLDLFCKSGGTVLSRRLCLAQLHMPAILCGLAGSPEHVLLMVRAEVQEKKWKHTRFLKVSSQN